jgi:hypothetical protein
MRRRVAVVVLVAALAGACNSTTRTGRVEGSGAGSPLDTTVAGDGGGGPGGTGASTTVAAGEAGGGAVETAGGGPAGSGTDTPSASSGGAPAPAAGSPIPIGIRYYDQRSLQAFAAAYGIGGSVPDPRAYAEAVVADVNARGGLAGRRIAPVYHPVDASRSITQQDAVNQEACAAFTEDHHVFAAVSTLPGNIGETFVGCMAAKGAIVVADPLLYVDREYLDRYRAHLYLPGAAQSTRFGQFWIDRLASTGFFRGGTVGVLWYDDAAGIYRRTVEQAVRPALQRNGVRLAQEFRLTSYTDSSQYASAVLRFKTTGVTHLLVLDVSSLVSFFFMAAAETQTYRPAYGLNSTSAFTFLQANAPDPQLANARGVGWMTALDVSPGQVTPTPVEARCIKAVGRNALTGAFDRLIAYWTCDTLWFLEETFARARTHDVAGFRAAAESTGSRDAPGTFRVEYPGGRHDGVAAARDVAYDTGCQCFRYTSAVYAVG